jgi:MoaA/NifB/PqqE/SkfB family radical SAM enzyme
MQNKFGSAPHLGIYPRDIEEREKFDKDGDSITINQSQFSFGPPEIQKKFVESQFNHEELKRYKEYREKWFTSAKNLDISQGPLAVICELVSTCNLGCSMCYTITEDFQNSVVGATRMLPWKIVKNIIDECAEIGVYSILFSWRGESTLYRQRDENNNIIDFPYVLEYARNKGLLEVTCLTHGQTIEGEFARKIVKAQPNWLNFSIDGLAKEYNKIRTPPSKVNDRNFNAFKKVTENIKNIVKIRNELGLKRPQIRTNAIFPSIYKNPKDYADFMYSIGVDWVTINEMLDFRDGEVSDHEIEKNWICSYPFQRLTISANGTILPCTGAHNEEEGLVFGQYIGSPPKKIMENGKLIVKNLKQMNLKEAWKCEKLNKVREAHRTYQRSKINPGCRNCRHGLKHHGVDWVPDEWDIDKMSWEGHTWRNG